eukprot:240320-Pleurochrysis_carterae.AAC.1
MARRVPYGELSYVESRYRIPYASLVREEQEDEQEEVVPQIYTFSSWNIPMLGPSPDDAMNESVQDDGGD